MVPLVSAGGFLTVLVAFALAPYLLVRVGSLLFPKDDARRAEMIAEYYVVPRRDKPFWALEQLVRGLIEGTAARLKLRAQGQPGVLVAIPIAHVNLRIRMTDARLNEVRLRFPDAKPGAFVGLAEIVSSTTPLAHLRIGDVSRDLAAGEHTSFYADRFHFLEASFDGRVLVLTSYLLGAHEVSRTIWIRRTSRLAFARTAPTFWLEHLKRIVRARSRSDRRIAIADWLRVPEAEAYVQLVARAAAIVFVLLLNAMLITTALILQH